MCSQGSNIIRQDKGNYLISLLEFCNAFAAELQETGGQCMIAMVAVGMESTDSETVGIALLSVELEKCNCFMMMAGNNKKELPRLRVMENSLQPKELI